MVASWYFIWGCISMRPAGIYKSHDLLSCISGSTDFGLRPDYQGYLRFLSKVASQDLLMVASWYLIWGCISTSWPIFHSPLTSYFGQVIKVKIFVQDGISRPVNGSKLIFHIRMYLYETSRDIQEPWPPDLYFMVCWDQTSWYFISGCISMRPAGIYKNHDLLTYISRSAEIRLWSIFHG